MASQWRLDRVGTKQTYRIPCNKKIACGRHSNNEIRVASTYTSTHHCIFFIRDGRLFVQDLKSTNGIYVNNADYWKEEVALADEDRVGIGCVMRDDQLPENFFPMFIVREEKPVCICIDLLSSDDEVEAAEPHRNNVSVDCRENAGNSASFSVDRSLNCIEISDEEDDTKPTCNILGSTSAREVETNINLSQVLIEEIKQEFKDCVDLYDNENEHSETEAENQKPEMEIYEEDDEDFESNQCVSKWAMKLSQNTFKLESLNQETKRPSTQEILDKADELEKLLQNAEVASAANAAKASKTLTPCLSEEAKDSSTSLPIAEKDQSVTDKQERNSRKRNHSDGNSIDKHRNQRKNSRSDRYRNSGQPGISLSKDSSALKTKRCSSEESTLDMPSPPKTPPHLKEEPRYGRRVPPLIDAPNLPINRGKLRGVSAGKLCNKKLEQVINKIKRQNSIERQNIDLKRKWSSTVGNRTATATKKTKATIQDERKKRLKELADLQAEQRNAKPRDIKITTKAKCKVTDKNRGSFLTDGKLLGPPTPAKIAKRRFSTSGASSSRNNAHSNPTNDNDDKKVSVSSEHINKCSSRVSENINPSASTSSFLCAELHSSLVEQSYTVPKKLSLKSITHNFSTDHSLPGNSKTQTGEHLVSAEDKENTIKQDLEPLRLTIVKPYDKNIQPQKSALKISKTPLNVLKRKRVSFGETKIKYYEVDLNTTKMGKVNGKDAPAPSQLSKLRESPSSHLKIDYSSFFLTEILNWSPRWLGKDGIAKINGSHTLLPMMQQFQTLADFYGIIFPLMKIELWAEIDKENHLKVNENRIKATIKSFHTEKPPSFSRLSLQCEMHVPSNTNSRVLPNIGDLVIVYLEKTTVFAYVKNMRKTGYNTSCYAVTFELNSKTEIISNLKNKKTIYFKSITHIRVELGVFNSVKQLKFSPLCKAILNPFENIRHEDISIANVEYCGSDPLNTNQEEILLRTYLQAIDEKKPQLSLIEGPPGTGKSRLIANLVLQILYGSRTETVFSKKVLVCAQSNAAVDVIALKLLEIRSQWTKEKFKLVRFGVLDRIHKQVQCVSLESLVSRNLKLHCTPTTSSEKSNLIREKRALEFNIASMEEQSVVNTVSTDEIKNLKNRLEMVKRIIDQQSSPEEVRRQSKILLEGADIVCATLSSCLRFFRNTDQLHFDICIVDEATQCSEPYTLIPLQFGVSSLILVGDTLQLPATIQTKIAEEYGFGTSLFTRIQRSMETIKANPVQLLKTQYRMHPEICAWPNFYFYKGLLKTAEEAKTRNSPFNPYCILSLPYDQNTLENQGKIMNSSEAEFIIKLIKHMSAKAATEIFRYGIITPYAQQKNYLHNKIRDAGFSYVQVNTIDSYQGKETDVIIFSVARTVGVGFLDNFQRLNVALTRARRCLILCGNFNNLEQIPVWKSLLEESKRRNVFYELGLTDINNFEDKVMCHIHKSS